MCLDLECYASKGDCQISEKNVPAGHVPNLKASGLSQRERLFETIQPIS